MMENEAYFNPFPGLRAFEEDEEYLFFGREKQLDDLLNKLAKTHFLAVIGTSGSGKSSLVKSGLLPSLHSGFIKGIGKGWRIGVFRPGDNPIGNLATCLSGDEFKLEADGEEDFNLQPMMESVLRRSDDGIANVVHQFLDQLPENILLVADQFEELFRFSKYEKTSQKGTRDSVLFINLLLTAAKDRKRRIYIVFTMRSDFIGNCTEFRGFPEAINRGQYLIPRMTREEIKLAISGPIAVSGATISPQLVTMFLNEIGDNLDQLPILQHALMRTCDYWANNTDRTGAISIEHYESIGKMELALSNHADEAYFELTDSQKAICASLFKALTEVGTTAGGVRKPTKVSELCALLSVNKKTLIPVIDVFRLRGRSFLMPPIEIELDENSVIDISHESLMRVWLRLVKWFKKESDSVEVYLGLCRAALLHKEGKAGLYRDPELQLALKWKDKQNSTQLWANRYNADYRLGMDFLEESKKQFYFRLDQVKIAAKRRKRRAIYLIIALIIAFIASLLFASWVTQQKEITDSLLIKAKDEQKKTYEAIQRADDALLVADSAKQKAILSADKAQKAAKKAKDQAIIANQQKNIALDAKKKAEVATDQAMIAQRRALVSRIEADTAKNRALRSAQFAANQLEIAEESKEETERLKRIADARYDALLAIKKLDNKQTTEGIKLALSAQAKSLENGGNERDAVIYEALTKSLSESGKAKLTVDNSRGLRKIIAHPFKNTLATLNEDAQLIFAELTGDERLNTIDLKPIKGVLNFSFSSDGNYMVINKKDNSFSLYNLNGNGVPQNILNSIVLPESISQIESLNDNKFLLLTTSGIYYYQIENENLKEIEWQRVIMSNISQIASDNRNLIIAHSSSNELTITRRLDSSVLQSVKVNCEDLITSIEILNGSDFMAVGMSNGSLRLLSFSYDLGIQNDYVFSNHSSEITNIEFFYTLDDVLLLTSSLDNTINILSTGYLNESSEFERKKAIKGVNLKGHNLWINDFAVSFDKKHFFTASEDKTMRLWYIHPKDMVTILEENE